MKPGPKQLPISVRFEKFVVRYGADECWKWIGSTDKLGYGRIRNSETRKPNLAHRVSWEIHNGEIPTGLDVMHLCHNPNCTNPKHLALGTRKQNLEMSSHAGRLFRKIPFSDISEIVGKRNSGITLATIAEKYGCDKTAVGHYLKRNASHAKEQLNSN